MITNNQTCNFCWGATVDIGNHESETLCPLCAGAGVINEQQRREGVAVRTLVRFADLPILSELRGWEWYIARERAK